MNENITYIATKRGRPYKLTAEQRADVIRRYTEDHESANVLAEEYKVARSTIAYLLAQAGIATRTPSEAQRLRWRRRFEEEQ